MEIKTVGSLSTAGQRMVVMHSLSHAKLDKKQPFSSPTKAWHGRPLTINIVGQKISRPR